MSDPDGELLPVGIQRAVRFVCGCGTPEHFWQTILDILEMSDAPRDLEKPSPLYAWLSPCVDGGDDPVRWFALYVVSGLDLLEHGCSVRGSWLTDDGRGVLSFLREYGTGWQDEEGHDWVDADDVHWGVI